MNICGWNDMPEMPVVVLMPGGALYIATFYVGVAVYTS